MVAIPSSSRSMLYPSVVNQTGPFPIDFPVFDGSGADLRVTLNGATVAGWTFSGDIESGFYGDPSTWVNGKIDFAQPITGVLRIKAGRSARRIAQYAEGRGIPARDHNTEYNILTAGLQELQRDLDEFNGDSLQEAIDLAAGSAALAAGYATSSGNSAASAEASANAAIAAASSVINATYNTRSDAAAATVPVIVQYLRTAGYGAIGDLGGALYKRVGGAPAHPGWFQDAAGAYFEISEPRIRPEMLGALGNDANDDGPASRNAALVAQVLSVPLHFSRSRVYRIATGSGVSGDGYERLIDVSNLTVEIEGEINGVFSSGANIILYAGGTIGANVALSANIVAGQTTFDTATAHGLVGGDIIKVGSDALFETDTNSKQGELTRVSSVAGVTIALKTGVQSAYNTANSAAVNKMSMARSYIQGTGLVRGFGRLPSDKFQIGIAQHVCDNPVVDGIRIERCNTMGLWARDCFGGLARLSRVRDIESTGQGYGVATDGATQDYMVFGGVFENCGHAVTTSNSSSVRGVQRRILFSHLRAVGTALRGASFNQPSDAFDTHPGANDVTFQSCISMAATGSAFNIECARARIIDCAAFSPGADAISWVNRTGLAGRVEIRGFNGRSVGGSGRLIFVSKHASYSAYEAIMIEDVIGYGVPGNGIHVAGDTAVTRTKSLIIRGCDLRQISGSHGIYVEWFDGARIAGNLVEVATSTGTGITVRDVQGGKVEGNIIDLGTSTGDAIRLNSSVTSGITRLVVEGNTSRGGGTGSTGVRVDAGAQNCSFAANDFRTCTTEENIPAGQGHRRAAYTSI